MRKSPRQPRTVTKGRYPRVNVVDNRIWLQSSPGGKKVKVPKKFAFILADRLYRAAKKVNAA